MTITAKNIGRINVWPTYDIAREADTEECKFVGQLTVWRTNEEAQANISHEEEGGTDDRPDWVPENAVIHIDLVGGSPQGRAWAMADGVVAVDTLLGSDPNTEGAWDTTEYDVANLTADGYGSTLTSVDVATIGALRTAILAGTTMRFQVKNLLPSSGTGAMNFALLSLCATTCPAIVFDLKFSDESANVESWTGDLAGTIATCVNLGGHAVNVMALTITPLRAEFSVNSFAALGAVINSDEYPTSGADPIIAAMFSITNHAIQSITLYDTLPDTTGLSELSETA